MKNLLIAACLISLLAAAGWAEPGPGGGGKGYGKRERIAAWKHTQGQDRSTTCPATGERKHRKDRKRIHQPDQQQWDSQQTQ